MAYSYSFEVSPLTKSQLTGIRIALAIAGVAALAIGIAVFVWPESTLMLVAWLFGLYFVVVGILRIARSFSGTAGSGGYRVFSFILGLLLLAAGVYLMINPEFGVELLAYAIGIAWIIEGVAALVDRPAASPRWLSVTYGLLSIIGGILIFFIPVTAVVFLLKIAAILLMIAGAVQVVQAITLGRKAKAVTA